MTDQPSLGMRWTSRGGGVDAPAAPPIAVTPTMTSRSALWQERWPLIAKQECIDKVEASPLDRRPEVLRALPCSTCELMTACLNAKRKEIGSLMYDREIQTSPRTSESSLFPSTLLDPLKIGEGCSPFWHKPFSLEHDYVVVQGWDIAWSEKTGGDYLVCTTAYGHLTSGRSRILDVQRWQGLMFGQQIDLIVEKHKTFQSDLVVIEGDFAQTIWARETAKRPEMVPVLSHNAGGEKHSLQIGVPSLLIEFENRRISFPWAEGYHHDEIVNMFNELEAFGWVDGQLQGVGEHDDTVMSLWHTVWGLKQFMGGRIQETHRGMQPGAQV